MMRSRLSLGGSEPTAACGGRKEASEWQRSIKSRKSVSPMILSGTATVGCATSSLLAVAKSVKLCFRQRAKTPPTPLLLLSPQSRLCRAPSGLKAMEKKSHKDSIRIVITHEDCGNIEIQNNLWYNAINSTNLNLTR